MAKNFTMFSTLAWCCFSTSSLSLSRTHWTLPSPITSSLALSITRLTHKWGLEERARLLSAQHDTTRKRRTFPRLNSTKITKNRVRGETVLFLLHFLSTSPRCNSILYLLVWNFSVELRLSVEVVSILLFFFWSATAATAEWSSVLARANRENSAKMRLISLNDWRQLTIAPSRMERKKLYATMTTTSFSFDSIMKMKKKI